MVIIINNNSNWEVEILIKTIVALLSWYSHMPQSLVILESQFMEAFPWISPDGYGRYPEKLVRLSFPRTPVYELKSSKLDEETPSWEGGQTQKYDSYYHRFDEQIILLV